MVKEKEGDSNRHRGNVCCVEDLEVVVSGGKRNKDLDQWGRLSVFENRNRCP